MLLTFKAINVYCESINRSAVFPSQSAKPKTVPSRSILGTALPTIYNKHHPLIIATYNAAFIRNLTIT